MVLSFLLVQHAAMDERTAFARHLRRNMTPEERALWNVLSRFRPRFTSQLRIDPYVADFACRSARVIVEVDGGQHADNRNDLVRTANLERAGWRVVRFWNSDIRDNLDAVITAISIAVGDRIPNGDGTCFVASRAGRDRLPRTRKIEPPPAPPAKAGGES